MDHEEHGRGTEEDGPDAPDCPCRGTKQETACARAGCGFCIAAVIARGIRCEGCGCWLEHPEDGPCDCPGFGR